MIMLAMISKILVFKAKTCSNSTRKSKARSLFIISLVLRLRRMSNKVIVK